MGDTTGPALVLAGMMLIAGCGTLPGGTDTGETRTVNPQLQGTPTRTESPTPAARVNDSNRTAIMRGHRAALRERSYTYQVERIIEGPNGTVFGTASRIVRVNGTERLVSVKTGGTAPGRVGLTAAERTVWANDTQAVKRTIHPNGYTLYEAETGSSFGLPERPVGESVVRTALRGVNLTFDRVVTQDGQTAFRARGSTDSLTRRNAPDLRYLRVRMIVTKTGFIRSITMTYQMTRAGKSMRVVVLFRVIAVNTTVVNQPEWYETAVNASQPAGA